MPELAEVEYFRKQWNPGLGKKVLSVKVHPRARLFRECPVDDLTGDIKSSILKESETHGKQMLFRFSGGKFVGIHLGMTGKLFVKPKPYAPGKWDHLVIEQAKQVLVFSDPRQFGKVLYEQTKGVPAWWKDLPPALLSDAFDREALAQFLKRRKRSPIKAVLLMQERFPGVGNWMADEILWRARIAPACLAGDIEGRKITTLWKVIREVCQDALEVIGTDWGDPPDDWLFNHRWKDGGICPKTKKPLVRETIGGRTTCWSPAWQWTVDSEQ